MPKYVVTILESRTHDYVVDASNEDEARDLAMAEYENDDDQGDYLGGEVTNVEDISDQEE